MVCLKGCGNTGVDTAGLFHRNQQEEKPQGTGYPYVCPESNVALRQQSSVFGTESSEVLLDLRRF